MIRTSGGGGVRVTLVRPNVVIFPQSLSFYGPVPPVGLAYVASVLRDGGHDVDVIDSVGDALDVFEDFDSPVGRLRRIGLSPDEVVARIHPDTQVLGVTNMFLHEWPLIRDIIEKAKAEYPHLVVMAGGDNATAYFPWMFEQSDALDYCVLGEGEATALELVNRVAAGLSMVGLQGIAAREALGEDGACDTGLSIRTRKLDTIPRPAWDLFPIEEYLAYADFWGVHRGRSMPMLATRGCPYKCTFCSSPQMWTTKYVVRDPDDVADEIAEYVDTYGVQNVNFSDLTAITRRKWTLEFADALEARDLGISWQLPTGTRAEALDAEVLQRLWDTGCRNIKYAPESGSERMLEIYDKRVKLSTILESLKAAEKIGIITGVNIILGHPKETWPDVWKSFLFLMKAAWAGCNDACVMIFGPYPGSEDWKALVDSGVVVVDDDYHYVALSRGSSQAVSYNPRMSARQLRWAQMSMMVVFYAVSSVLHPPRLWAYVKSLFTGDETTAVDQLIRIKRKGFKRLTPRLTDPVDGALTTPVAPVPKASAPNEPEPALGPAAEAVPTLTPTARVALIRSNVVMMPQSLSFWGPVPPIGLAYIAAVLRDAGHDVDVIDSVGEAIEQFEDFDSPAGRMRRIGLSIEEILDRIHPDTRVVGITNMFVHEWGTVRDLVEAIKVRFPDVLVMLGGDNATAFWPWMFEQTDAIDLCVLGEGEATAVEVVDRVAAGRSLAGLQGIAAREPVGEDGACDTGLSVRRRKLSEIPQPAWDQFPIDEYLAYADFWGVHHGRSMPILATRGCPYKCSFCSSPQMWTTRYVVRDPDEVADEIAGYVRDYDIANINFSDLTAITRRKWTLEFCDALEARHLDITWQLPTGTRAEALDAEVLRRLWETGCRYIKYAPESGSERMLEIYDKRLKLSTILDSLKEARKVGIVTGINIIIGHPEETWHDVWLSFRFMMKAAKAGCSDCGVVTFGPYPGSADFHGLVERGEVVVDEAYPYVALARGSSESVSYNPRMTNRQMRAAQWSMMVAFYALGHLLHPKRFVDHVRAFFSGHEVTAVDQLIRTKRKGFRRLEPAADPAPEPVAA